ncbi:hypothetical protein CVT91_08990 [Candidatus Atribacteria bacterium HGW-Atribacteria-1]|nr:MAG: hypothetical protein CVT91_08990 [Candidatus Atribacteria bacterium HGW-Atribacteria-1]
MSYKKLIISLLILSLILISTGCLGKLIPTTPSVTPPAGTAGVLYLEPANLSLTPSQDFAVELKTTSITNLKGYSVTLSYDPTFISLQEVTEGPFLSEKGETFFYKKVDDTKDTILIDCAVLGSKVSVSGEGTLATLSFTCLKAGSTSIEFSLAKTRDAHNKEIVITKRNTKLKSK